MQHGVGLQIIESKAEAIKGGHFEEAAVLHDWERDLKAQLVAPATEAAPIALVDTDDVARVVAAVTGVPVDRVTDDEAAELAGLEAALGERVVGQPVAVAAAAGALRRARVGMKDPSRPIASMLFCGPTGVGKTCLTAEIASHLFSSPVRPRTPRTAVLNPRENARPPVRTHHSRLRGSHRALTECHPNDTQQLATPPLSACTCPSLIL